MAKTYLVGGAVRDELLGKPTNDFDYLVVGATVEELRARFGEPVGVDFPVFLDKNGDQYAMARRERKTGRGYSGFTCEFGPDVTLEEDLSRRDLTINALAKDVDTGEIIDCFGGLDDLKNKVLRHTSAAFSEDPLRVVRLARFAARYKDFTIDPETRVLASDIVKGGEMDWLPFERYWLEVDKALLDGNIGQFMRVLALAGAFERIKFFYEVWGSDVNGTIANIERINRVLRVADDAKLTFFVALTARHDLGKVHGVTNLMFAIHENIKRIKQMRNLDVNSMYELLKCTKAWTQSTLIDDVITCTQLLLDAGHVCAVYPGELIQIAEAVREVTSEPYQHLSGKEIGSAMESARKTVIDNMIKLLLKE